MEVPSPRFSSVVGDEVENDEEINEIIRCILHNESLTLEDILGLTHLDVTSIRDEMGYSLIHLAAYNNVEKCLEVLLLHFLNAD